MSIPITGKPTMPDLSDPSTFNSRAQNLLNWITGSMIAQFEDVDPADWFNVQSSGSDLTSGKLLLTDSLSSVFTASVAFFARSTAPTGWVKANGATLSRTTYANLFAAIGTTFGSGDGSTTFALPDMRAIFPRGWDDSRGTDLGRALGSYQEDAVQAHTHSASSSTNGSHVHQIRKDIPSSQGSLADSVAANQGTSNYLPINTQAAGDHSHTITVGAMNSGSSAVETRVKNVALLACIKY